MIHSFYHPILKTHSFRAVLFLSILCCLAACDIKNNKIEPQTSFTKIYDNGDFERAYYPLDIRQTADSGYVVMGMANVENSDFLAAYLMKIDKAGQFKWEHISDRFVNPVSELIGSGNSWRFFCMDKDNLGTHLVQFDATAGIPQSVAAFEKLTYPLAASAVPGGNLVLYWDREDKKTMKLARLNGNGIGWTKGYDIFEDVEKQVIEQVTHRRKPQIPFMAGATAGGQLYFNGFNNFKLTLTFVSPNDGEETGVLNGTRYESSVSQVLPLPGGKFAVSRYKEDGENVYSPLADIAATGTATAKDLPGNQLPELSRYARVAIRRGTIGGTNVILYASDTKNGQIALFAYDETTGKLLGTKYLGAGNAFEMGGITFTQDGGIAVAGRIFVAGRFPRICVFKLSPSEAQAMIGAAKE